MSSAFLDEIEWNLKHTTWDHGIHGFMVGKLRKQLREGKNRHRIITLLTHVDAVFAETSYQLTQEIAMNRETGPYREIIRLLFAYSTMLSGPFITRQYYRREALGYSHLLEKHGTFTAEDVIIRWELFCSLGLIHQAVAFLDIPHIRNLLDSRDLIFLEAKGQYSLGNYLDIPGILSEYPKTSPLDKGQRLRQYWNPQDVEYEP